jgi:hypothetical protein
MKVQLDVRNDLVKQVSILLICLIVILSFREAYLHDDIFRIYQHWYEDGFWNKMAAIFGSIWIYGTFSLFLLVAIISPLMILIRWIHRGTVKVIIIKGDRIFAENQQDKFYLKKDIDQIFISYDTIRVSIKNTESKVITSDFIGIATPGSFFKKESLDHLISQSEKEGYSISRLDKYTESWWDKIVAGGGMMFFNKTDDRSSGIAAKYRYIAE